jgi:hypothetical protein
MDFALKTPVAGGGRERILRSDQQKCGGVAGAALLGNI